MSENREMGRAFDEMLNTIICGDCAVIMAAMPDNCIDLTVTSPPY